MGLGEIFGRRRGGCLMRRWRRRTAGSGAWRGLRCLRERRRSMRSSSGCRMRRWMRRGMFACVRPVRYFQGVPSPVREPEKMDVVIFRENTEDVYIGIEWKSGTPEVKKLLDFLNKEMLGGGKKQIRMDSGVGIKPISPFGTKRLVRRAIQYALANNRKLVTLVHKGNIQKFTEGAFRDWGYDLAREEFRAETVTERESWILDNLDKNPNLSVEQNGEMIEPGLERATDAFKKTIYAEVKKTLEAIGASHGKGQWKMKLMVNDRIRDSVVDHQLHLPLA